MGRKKEDGIQTVTIYIVLEYLLQHSSAKHKLSIAEISQGLTDKMYDYSHGAIKYDSYSVDEAIKRQVSRLLEAWVGKDILFGIKIIADKQNSSGRSNAFDQIYYAESVFTDTQIILMRDAVSVFPYAETAATADIVKRLNSITPEYNRVPYNPDMVSAIKYPGTYFENLKEINKAFSKIKYAETPSVLTKAQQDMTESEYNKLYAKKVNKLKFRYCEYGMDKKLHIRKTRKGEEWRVVNPLKLMWVNGYYYLITFERASDKSAMSEHNAIFVNYRVDRMVDVICLDEEAENIGTFNEDSYRYKNPVMYSDRDGYKTMVLRCSERLINNVIDTFGFNVNIRTPEEHYKRTGKDFRTDNDDGFVIVEINSVGADGLKMWALEYGYGAEILEPESLREEMYAAAENLLKMYKK